MIVLGIDPGYAIVGCGVVEYKNNHFTMLDYGAVTTPAGMPFNLRLERIYDGVSELMEKYKPEAMSIEKLFYNNNAKTVIDVSQARGVLVLAAQKHRIPIFEYTPLQVKQSVVPADAPVELRLAASQTTLTDHDTGAAAEFFYGLVRSAEAAS